MTKYSMQNVHKTANSKEGFSNDKNFEQSELENPTFNSVLTLI
jgi:hypothetical protein